MQASLGDWKLSARPEMGGALTALCYHGVDVLRRQTDESCHSPLETSAFAMVPYSGRIRDGQFNHRGRRLELPANFQPEPHAIHGLGWTSAWREDQRTSASLSFVYQHDGSVWPWAFDAQQTFSAEGGTFSVHLALTNTSSEPMPAGIGWHPYFPDAASAALTAPVTAIWQRDADGIPIRPRELDDSEDLRTGKPVCSLSLDDCFSVKAAPVEIAWPDRGLSLKMEAVGAGGFLVVYTPAGQSFFCVEPVSHIPDAVNSAFEPHLTGYQELPPEGVLSLTIRLAVEHI